MPNDPLCLEAAICCELSYLDFHSAEFTKGLVDLGFDNICTIDVAGVQAFCAANAQRAVICFTGTNSFADWLADLMSPMVSCDGTAAKVHTGFFRTLEVCDEKVEEFIATLRPGLPIHIYGHSLGGGMALVYAHKSTRDIDCVITFGCPRTGNQAFVDAFNARFEDSSIRFVNNADSVPCVPPKSWGYRHVWHLSWFDGEGKLINRIHKGFWRKLGNTAIAIPRMLYTIARGGHFRDHSIHDYRRLVEAFVSSASSVVK